MCWMADVGIEKISSTSPVPHSFPPSSCLAAVLFFFFQAVSVGQLHIQSLHAIFTPSLYMVTVQSHASV